MLRVYTERLWLVAEKHDWVLDSPQSEADVSFSEQADQYLFRVPARASLRPAVSGFLSTICHQLESTELFTAQMTHQVISAFTEAYTNVVKHAYSESEGSGHIKVEFTTNSDFLEIVISDSGKTFEIEKVPEPNLNALPESGMGIYIMKQFMDDVTYSHDDGYNRLRMRKAYTKENRLDAQH